ncbi:MAG TPA: c-type cytochrome domain-containing protein [Ohtaekwangia sp.]|nr:c-type cytochrome domain-containing protein [Ohtaekwangia sp.]
MQRLTRFAENLLFVLNVFIIFLLIFEQQLMLPPWLQVVGRMHPLVLHFPIVMVLGAMVLYIVRHSGMTAISEDVIKGAVFAAALLSSLTVIMGLFLAKEDGYSGDVLLWHKWTGTGAALASSAFYHYLSLNYPPIIGKVAAGVVLACIVVAGHFGAALTHGEDFLLAPFRQATSDRVVPPLAEALIYDDVVAPILEEKCASCHNASKAKGALSLDTPDDLLKGGKDGPLFAAGQPFKSLLWQRIDLPEDDRKHMPPANKPQLSRSEAEIIFHWIRSGADFRKKIVDVHPADTFRALLERRIRPTDAVYNFPPADPEVIEALNTAYRVVRPVAANAPALAVNIYNAGTYKTQLLEDLLKVKDQVISLDLNKLPVVDSDIKVIAKFENLQKLYLNFTDISGATLGDLKPLKKLGVLSLSSTKIAAHHLAPLSEFKSLKQLYIWNTAVTPEEIAELRIKLEGVAVETGFAADHSRPLRLPAPRIEQERKIFTGDFSVRIDHPVRGATIRYTLDGTEPDSVTGLIYDSPVQAAGSITTLKARAYKAGWYGSERSGAVFYQTRYTPDTVILKTLPDKKYSAKGGETLRDHEAGDTNFGSRGGWLGFQGDPVDMLVAFTHPVELTRITLSMNCDVGGHIFPPSRFQVWGGQTKDHLELLGTVVPDQPKGYMPAVQMGLECVFKPTRITHLRIIAEPLPQLPKWHQYKGQKGWLFLDELLFN